MNEYRFPYVIIDEKEYPMIPVSLEYENIIKENIYALLDSGADISLFRRDIGEELKIPFDSLKEETISGIGNGLVVCKQNIKIKIGKGEREIVLKIIAAFAKDRDFQLNIIGREYFFDRTNITFLKNKEIIIEIG